MLRRCVAAGFSLSACRCRSRGGGGDCCCPYCGAPQQSAAAAAGGCCNDDSNTNTRQAAASTTIRLLVLAPSLLIHESIPKRRPRQHRGARVLFLLLGGDVARAADAAADRGHPRSAGAQPAAPAARQLLRPLHAAGRQKLAAASRPALAHAAPAAGAHTAHARRPPRNPSRARRQQQPPGARSWMHPCVLSSMISEQQRGSS